MGNYSASCLGWMLGLGQNVHRSGGVFIKVEITFLVQGEDRGTYEGEPQWPREVPAASGNEVPDT